jgi:hypothetical protein
LGFLLRPPKSRQRTFAIRFNQPSVTAGFPEWRPHGKEMDTC